MTFWGQDKYHLTFFNLASYSGKVIAWMWLWSNDL